MKTILSLSALSFLLSCASIEPITFKGVQNFDMKKITSSPQIAFSLNLFNPNAFGLKLKSVDLDVMLNEKQIAAVELAEKVKIPQSNAFLVPVLLRPQVNDASDILNMGLEGMFSKEMQLSVNGNIRVKKSIFSKKIPFTYNRTIDPKNLFGQ